MFQTFSNLLFCLPASSIYPVVWLVQPHVSYAFVFHTSCSMAGSIYCLPYLLQYGWSNLLSPILPVVWLVQSTVFHTCCCITGPTSCLPYFLKYSLFNHILSSIPPVVWLIQPPVTHTFLVGLVQPPVFHISSIMAG